MANPVLLLCFIGFVACLLIRRGARRGSVASSVVNVITVMMIIGMLMGGLSSCTFEPLP